MFFRRYLRAVSTGLLGLLLTLLLSGLPGLSQPKLNIPGLKQPSIESPQSSPVPAATNALSDPQDLEKLMDAVLEGELKNSTTPGAAISVVKDGEIIFAKGYGYADIDKKTPVDVERTLFRVASLSKLFTITGTMQLYEQGLINLDEDISQYLDFKLSNPYPEPVTFAQVMTHTDGSTKRRIGLAARTEGDLQTLAEHLPGHMPPITWRPGTLYSYSSYSIALLGYLLERISNTPFTQYIDQRILQPLDMQRSTFLQPPPTALANDLAVGYQKRGQQFKPVPYLYLNIYPGAALQSTATDMAHFMIAHLQSGRYKNQQILQPDTARLMHVTQFADYPGLPGTSYGFRERLVNNIRTIGHLGSLRGYSSSLTLLPDHNVGIFVASNSFSGVHDKIIQRFFDRYFPVSETSTPQSVSDNVDLDQFTGYYRDVEYPRHTFAKLTGVFEHIQIIKDSDNTLTVQTPNLLFAGKVPQNRLEPLDPPLFRRVKDNATAAFNTDTSGKLFAFNVLYPKIGAYVRVPWYESIWVQLGTMGVCSLFFLSATIAWLIRPLSQSIGQGNHKVVRARDSLGWTLTIAGLVGGLNLLFLVGLPTYLWWIGAWKLAYGVPIVVIGLLCLPVLAAALTFVLPVTAIAAWTKGHWTLTRRLHYSLVTLAALAFIPVLSYWNLLGFHF